MKEKVSVFFTADENYAPYLSTAIYSARCHIDKNRNYRIIVLEENMTKETITKIRNFSKENFSVEVYSMKQKFNIPDNREGNRLRCDYFTMTIFFRLFISNMFPDIDKCIYIDSDTVITDDISKLYDIELGENLIGACPDLSIADCPPLVEYTEKGVGIGKGRYINSGVLLMNLKYMRELKFEEHFLDLFKTYKFDTIAPDQDYINAICKDKILFIDGRWNKMPVEGGRDTENSGIIHYNLFSKPWCYDNVQFADYFWKYAEGSGFLEEIKAYKESYSNEQKDNDAACMQELVSRGIEITACDDSFAKTSAKGVKIAL